LDEGFKEYLNSDGVFVPEGSDNVSVGYIFCLPQCSLQFSLVLQRALFRMMRMGAVGRSFSFPDLDDRIRQTIREYGVVFPKLNFSSPQVSLFHG
jgi:hypothetical protein